MAFSAYPGLHLDESTSKVWYPNAASLGMYPELAIPFVRVTIMVLAKGDSLLSL